MEESNSSYEEEELGNGRHYWHWRAVSTVKPEREKLPKYVNQEGIMCICPDFCLLMNCGCRKPDLHKIGTLLSLPDHITASVWSNGRGTRTFFLTCSAQQLRSCSLPTKLLPNLIGDLHTAPASDLAQTKVFLLKVNISRLSYLRDSDEKDVKSRPINGRTINLRKLNSIQGNTVSSIIMWQSDYTRGNQDIHREEMCKHDHSTEI